MTTPNLQPAVGPQPTTKKPRLPRFRRVKNPPHMVLTERDREIFRAVHDFRLMTREQIEKLLFPPENGQDHFTKTSQVRKRLKLLYHHGYLERIPTPIKPGTWAWRPVYRLTRKGAKLIAIPDGTTTEKLSYWGKGFDKDRRRTQISFLFLDHMLHINDVRIAITLAARAKGYRIEKWLDDSTLKGETMKEHVSLAGRGEKIPVIPDAYFVLNLGDRRAHFFLELDRATMASRRWKSKILAYRAYVESGKYQKRYQTQSLRILTVTTSRKRLDNLKETTEKAGGNQLFWFTLFDQAKENQILSSPIWSVAGDARLYPLIE